MREDANHAGDAEDVVDDEFGDGSNVRNFLDVDDGAVAPAPLLRRAQRSNEADNVCLRGHESKECLSLLPSNRILRGFGRP